MHVCMLMRINVVSFLDPYVYHGSGELNIRRSLEVGESRGHVIRMSTVRPQSRELHASPLISLLIDVFNHAHSVKSLGAWREFGVGFLEETIARASFVRLANAYAEVSNLPYLPCSGARSYGCPVKPGVR